jgi:hypothetical protein
MRVYHLFAPGCSTLLARLKAAESQRPKDTLVQTETVLLICSGILLAPARRRRRLGRHHGGCQRHGHRGAGDSVAAATTAMGTLSAATHLRLKVVPERQSALVLDRWI